MKTIFGTYMYKVFHCNIHSLQILHPAVFRSCFTYAKDIRIALVVTMFMFLENITVLLLILEKKGMTKGIPNRLLAGFEC